MQGEPVAPEKLTDLTVTVPRPAGWQDYTNMNLAPGTRVIAKGETYPSAMLMVFTLTGDIDVASAEARRRRRRGLQLQADNGSWENLDGFPSSMIEAPTTST